MEEFQFLKNPVSHKWVILAPRRAKRPDVAKGFEPVCPFCLGREQDENEVYRIGGSDADQNWQVRVLPNKYPFASIHEIIIHSPDHHKNFDELPLSQIELIIKTFRQRFLTHKDKGQVFIFHNRGEAGGESLPHPHTQLAVLPLEIKMDIPRLDPSASIGVAAKPINISSSEASEVGLEEQVAAQTKFFYLSCPKTSAWPDEVWVAPKNRGKAFGEVVDEEISDLSYILNRLIRILDLRHGREFPFNFHIYPGGDWYLRLIPRLKTIGGFELGSGIFINTQNPVETIKFIKEHFENPNEEKILAEHQAGYQKIA